MGSVVVIGGTSGLGREIVKHYVGKGREVVLSSRDPDRAAKAADELGAARGVVLDLVQPDGIAAALDGLAPVDHLVLAAIERDDNRVAQFDPARAVRLATLKLVGY